MIPLILKIKKELHKQIALGQDIIVQEMYKVFQDAVFHGGTAIWRCYQGNRFSEDIDVYLKKDPEKIETFFKNLEKKGFLALKKKVGENALYSNLRFNRVEVRFEATFRSFPAILKEYQTVDGNLISVYTLSAEQLITEKVNAYLGRLKIRDLYDIFFLLRYVKRKEEIQKSLQRLAKEFKKPFDEKELKVLLLEGLVPSSEKMISYIRTRV